MSPEKRNNLPNYYNNPFKLLHLWVTAFDLALHKHLIRRRVQKIVIQTLRQQGLPETEIKVLVAKIMDNPNKLYSKNNFGNYGYNLMATSLASIIYSPFATNSPCS